MSCLLALETSTNACSVAIQKNGKHYSDHLLIPREHTQKILPMIQRLLDQSALQISDMDFIAYGQGPGSFTGLRVGMGIAQGLSYAQDIPLVGVSSLQAIALGFAKAHNLRVSEEILVAMDARMEEVYWGVYKIEETGCKAVKNDAVDSPSSVVEYLADTGNTKPTVIGTGLNYEVLNLWRAESNIEVFPNAIEVAELGLINYRLGGAQSALEAQPQYLRDSVAWKKRTRIRSQR